MGLWMLSNNGILSSGSFEDQTGSIKSINEWGRKNIGFNFLSDQFHSVHLITFISFNVFLFFLLAFEGVLKDFGTKYLACLCGPCKRLQERIDESKEACDNFYDELSLKYLLSEY